MSDHHHLHHPSRKRTSPPPSPTTLTSPKKPKPSPPPQQPPPTTTHDEDDDDIDESSTLLSNLLEDFSKTTFNNPHPFKVKFVTYPYTPSSPFECCTSYVTINGNEESCGSSFSHSDSSLMASFHTCTGPHFSPNDVVFHSAEVLKSSLVKDNDHDVVWDWADFLGELGQGSN